VARVTRRCDWRIVDLIAGDRPATHYLVVPPSDISRTKHERLDRHFAIAACFGAQVARNLTSSIVLNETAGRLPDTNESRSVVDGAVKPAIEIMSGQPAAPANRQPLG
jgi:hypothetical protein